MSGQIATVEAAAQTSTRGRASAAPDPSREAARATEPGSVPEVTIQDVLVEDVSIDGMCGVY